MLALFGVKFNTVTNVPLVTTNVPRQVPDRLLIAIVAGGASTDFFPSLTVSFTMKLPAVVYVCATRSPVALPPSPKCHVRVSAWPSLSPAPCDEKLTDVAIRAVAGAKIVPGTGAVLAVARTLAAAPPPPATAIHTHLLEKGLPPPPVVLEIT